MYGTRKQFDSSHSGKGSFDYHPPNRKTISWGTNLHSRGTHSRPNLVWLRQNQKAGGCLSATGDNDLKILRDLGEVFWVDWEILDWEE